MMHSSSTRDLEKKEEIYANLITRVYKRSIRTSEHTKFSLVLCEYKTKNASGFLLQQFYVS